MTVGPDSFARVVDAIVESSGVEKIELALEVDAMKVDRASFEWLPLPMLFGLAQAAGWIRQHLAAEIDRQLGLPTRQPPREQGWRSPRVHARQEALPCT